MKKEYYCVCLGLLNGHPFGKEMFILLTMRVFRERLSNCVLASFSFAFEGRMWDLIVLVPDYCTSFYYEIILIST